MLLLSPCMLVSHYTSVSELGCNWLPTAWIVSEFKFNEESYKDVTGLHEWFLWVYNVE